jgi:putative ABC transport system permease protein
VKYLPFVWRNLTRNKLRTFLTSGAIALAIALVCLLRTMPDGMNRVLEYFASGSRISVHAEAGLVYPMPYSYLGKVRSVPGVDSAATWTWFGGVFRAEDGISFPSFAVEPEMLGVVWEDWGVAEAELEEFRRYRNAALVGERTMEKYDWKVGDLVTLQGTAVPTALEFKIVGTIPNLPHFMIQREYIDQALRSYSPEGLAWTGMIWARVDDRNQIESVMAEIDALFANSETVTASETEQSYMKNFFGMLEGLIVVILVVTALVALCIVFIAANTASMSVRERFQEIAILKAIGFSRRLLFGTLVAEATVLALLGGVLGVLIAFGLTSAARSAAEGLDNSFAPLAGFVVTQTILVQGIFLALVIGMLSGIVPSLGATRKSVAETLREVF